MWNGMIDRRPAVIVRCAGAADVISAVNYARDHNLVIAVRGGGHSAAGSSVCDRGLMIDLSLMKGIRVDPAHRTARAEPGMTQGELDRATQAFGLATTGGVVSTTGIAGLTLGGGIGWLGRTHGLACDNLLSVDVVTADGQRAPPVPTRMPTCSGRYAAAAATSVLSRPSNTACTTSVRLSWPVCWYGRGDGPRRSPDLPRVHAGGARECQRVCWAGDVAGWRAYRDRGPRPSRAD